MIQKEILFGCPGPLRSLLTGVEGYGLSWQGFPADKQPNFKIRKQPHFAIVNCVRISLSLPFVMPVTLRYV
ncbi:hypothetical protein BN2475_450008 [Paraburkholderia ribeironis]|uniref:Uncharacterized protein n=1 Tax=Paraburkholderia ribeironis TaxID=1247936 RepID=A0A1N7S8G5_9BURK|nr:hypothetical protein BN2475_450008 [Paraburkholderia ribeironis]